MITNSSREASLSINCDDTKVNKLELPAESWWELAFWVVTLLRLGLADDYEHSALKTSVLDIVLAERLVWYVRLWCLIRWRDWLALCPDVTIYNTESLCLEMGWFSEIDKHMADYMMSPDTSDFPIEWLRVMSLLFISRRSYELLWFYCPDRAPLWYSTPSISLWLVLIYLIYSFYATQYSIQRVLMNFIKWTPTDKLTLPIDDFLRTK